MVSNNSGFSILISVFGIMIVIHWHSLDGWPNHQPAVATWVLRWFAAATWLQQLHHFRSVHEIWIAVTAFVSKVSPPPFFGHSLENFCLKHDEFPMAAATTLPRRVVGLLLRIASRPCYSAASCPSPAFCCPRLRAGLGLEYFWILLNGIWLSLMHFRVLLSNLRVVSFRGTLGRSVRGCLRSCLHNNWPTQGDGGTSDAGMSYWPPSFQAVKLWFFRVTAYGLLLCPGGAMVTAEAQLQRIFGKSWSFEQRGWCHRGSHGDRGSRVASNLQYGDQWQLQNDL